jgi:multiple sugar transport system permease protein
MSQNTLDRFDPRRIRSAYRGATIEQKEALLGVALVLPSLLLVATVIVYPLLFNVYLSLHRVPLQGAPIWNAGTNFQWLLSNGEFWSSLWLTISFTLIAAVLSTVGGLAVTLLFRRAFPGRRLVRGLVLLPYVMPIVAIAFAWRWMFNPIYGVVPFVLGNLGFTELAQLSLLKSSKTALWTISLFEGWRYFPFAFLLIFARAQAIPNDVYEAAKIDGASKFAQFKDITLPELKYIVLTVLLLQIIWNFNRFADVWLISQEFEVLSVFTYETAFTTFRLGQAAAISVVLFLFLVVFVLLYVGVLMED